MNIIMKIIFKKTNSCESDKEKKNVFNIYFSTFESDKKKKKSNFLSPCKSDKKKQKFFLAIAILTSRL